MARNWNNVNDQPNTNYDAGNTIIYNAEVLRSTLCDYNGAYVLVRDDITTVENIAAQEPFKNYASFTDCITKIDGTTIDVTIELELVMSVYYVLEYSLNYSDTTGSLLFYSKDEATNLDGNIEENDDSKSFKHKTKLIGSTVNGTLENVTIDVIET